MEWLFWLALLVRKASHAVNTHLPHQYHNVLKHNTRAIDQPALVSFVAHATFGRQRQLVQKLPAILRTSCVIYYFVIVVVKYANMCMGFGRKVELYFAYDIYQINNINKFIDYIKLYKMVNKH